MKKLIPILFLTGCTSVQYAGTAAYSIKPIINEKTGQVVCCAVDVKNGKEITNLEAHISKQGDNYVIDLKEQGVAAFEGQRLAAGAAKEAVTAAAKAATTIVTSPALATAIPAAVNVLGHQKAGQ